VKGEREGRNFTDYGVPSGFKKTEAKQGRNFREKDTHAKNRGKGTIRATILGAQKKKKGMDVRSRNTLLGCMNSEKATVENARKICKNSIPGFWRRATGDEGHVSQHKSIVSYRVATEPSRTAYSRPM